MVIKILSSSATFNGVSYNTDKISKDLGELMLVANFGSLESLSQIRAEDYKNYLKMVSARNKRVSLPQFHAVISAQGKSHDKTELTAIACKWLTEMGYGDQPYMIVFHKDTDDHHVHLVSTRIDRNGKKISSAFEHIRAISVLNKVMGLDEKTVVMQDIEKALSYRVSTWAQFKMILESWGYVVKGHDLIKYGRKLIELREERVKFNEVDKRRAAQLKAIFQKYASRYSTALSKQHQTFRSDFADYLKGKMGIQLLFHAKDDKPPYGYSVIDHAQKNALKGSAIMPLKELLAISVSATRAIPAEQGLPESHIIQASPESAISPLNPELSEPSINFPGTQSAVHISISDDVDDEAIHGMRRHRKKKARTNLR